MSVRSNTLRLERKFDHGGRHERDASSDAARRSPESAHVAAVWRIRRAAYTAAWAAAHTAAWAAAHTAAWAAAHIAPWPAAHIAPWARVTRRGPRCG